MELLSICKKNSLSKTAKWQFSLHFIVAALGLFSIKANSPKEFPISSRRISVKTFLSKSFSKEDIDFFKGEKASFDFFMGEKTSFIFFKGEKASFDFLKGEGGSFDFFSILQITDSDLFIPNCK